MPAVLIDGKAVAAQRCGQLIERIAAVARRRGHPPGLAVLLVGNNPASEVYVRNKERKSAELGMHSRVVRLPATATQTQVLAAVDACNADTSIDSFLVQLPLPQNGHPADPIDEQTVLQRIVPRKDADGLHPHNLGRLVCGAAAPRPCTPAGIIALLDHAQVPLSGARAVVVGRSTIVGKPMALLLLERHATVTVCHSRSRQVAEEIRRADVVVAAVGKPNFIQGAWIAPGAAVIDVGINRVDNKLVGDVDFAAALPHAGCITPVPGGVGPMTIAMLLTNAVEAAERS